MPMFAEVGPLKLDKSVDYQGLIGKDEIKFDVQFEGKKHQINMLPNKLLIDKQIIELQSITSTKLLVNNII